MRRSPEEKNVPASWWREIGGAFLKLGCISFGGPIAHLGYLREEFVRKRRWLGDDAYADLVALCQFLPGPASSQVVFALGMLRSGLKGALLASFCFTLPSACLMILLGYGLSALGDLRTASWLHGLKLLAVAAVAQAVWGMGRRLCPDRPRITLGLAAAFLVLLAPTAPAQLVAIAGGALAGWLIYRQPASPAAGRSLTLTPVGLRSGALTLGVFGAILVVTPLVAALSGSTALKLFDSFYRAGSLVFGGGHVVLPMLRAELVPRGWIGEDAFLAGYGAAQALPGPLFTFAAYLGTVIGGGGAAWIWGVGCLFAIFLPAWLLVGGALPWWNFLRAKTWAQGAMCGANAAVVGVLLAALYHPLWTQSVRGVADAMGVVVMFALLEIWKRPPWLVVVLAAATGQWLL